MAHREISREEEDMRKEEEEKGTDSNGGCQKGQAERWRTQKEDQRKKEWGGRGGKRERGNNVKEIRVEERNMSLQICHQLSLLCWQIIW